MAATTAPQVQDQPLPQDYWAVICTIKQEPDYQFIRSEAKLAERMAAAGLLEPRGNKHYSITDYGQECYTAEKLLAVKQ
jgi:hypothetical protein